VRFTLTAGQKGDAPQAAALLEGLPAEVVMADTAYDADHLRQTIAAKGARAVIPNNPSRALKYPLDKHLYAQRHLVECCFSKLKQFRRVATRFEKTPEITVPSSLSPLSSYGFGKCPHYLALQLHFLFEMRAARFGLVGSAPQRPCDDVGGLNAALCKLHGDAADFLRRPADQDRRFAGRRGSVFLSGTALAR